MKKLKLFFACLLMAVLSIGQVWGADAASVELCTSWSQTFAYATAYTHDYSIDDLNGGTTTMTLGVQGVYRQANANTYFQMNKKTGYFKNTTALPGKITKIETTWSVAKGATKCYFANGAEATSSDATVTVSAGTSVTYTPDNEADYYFFNIDVSTGSGSAQMTSCVVYYEKAGGTPDPSISVTPSSWDFGTVHASAEASKVFSVSGSNLTAGDLTLTVPAGFSVSPSSIAVDGTLAATDVTVSKNTSDVDDYAGNLSITGGGLASAKTVGLTMTVDADPAPTGTFELFSGDIEEGDYVLVGYQTSSSKYYAMNSTVTSNQYLGITEVSIDANDQIVNPDASLVWTIEQSTNGYYIKQGSAYLDDNATSNKNYAQTVAEPTTTSEWAFAYDNTWTITNYGTETTKKTLSFNISASRVACYTAIQSGNTCFYLYKLNDGTSKASAGLAFDAAQKLAKVDGTLTAPNLSTADGFDGTVTYASSDETVVKVNASTGAITEIVAVGKAVITAHSDATENFKEGSASYTIFVAEQAGTNEDPLSEASAKALIDLDCGMDVYMVGTVATKNYYSTSKTYTVDLSGGMQYYYFYEAAGETVFETDYLKVGDIITAFGTLKKVNDKYRLNPSYMVDREEYTEPLVDISNTKETAYTVAQALALATNPTSDLTKAVYIAGVVYDVKSFNSTNGTLDIYIKDEGVENKFEFYKCAGIYDESLTAFTAADDVQVGDEVIGYGVMKYFSGGSIWEFDNTATGDYLVELTRSEVAVSSVELDQNEASIEVNETVTLHATVNPDNASDKAITWSVQSGSTYASVADGVVTGLVAGEAVIRAASTADPTKYAQCTVTVTAADPTKHVVTFDATIDMGESPLSKSNISMACSNGALSNGSEYRLYKSSTTTFECSVGNITKIEFTGVSGNPVSGFGDPEVGTLVTEGNDGVWTGNAASVAFAASGAQVRATLIKVTYKEDNRDAAGLAWNPAGDIELTVGDAFSAPALQNPNNIDAAEITIASDNTDLATVSAGVVSLVADATGTATITATFNGNDDYKPAVVSYTITVNEAGLDNVTFDATLDIAGTGELSIAKSGFTLEFTGGAMDNRENYRLYKSQTMTLSASDYLIKKIEFTCTSGNPISGFADATGLDKDNNEWTGESNTVELTASNAQVRMTKIKVFYVEDTRAAAGLAWNPAEDITLTVGDELTAPALLNPNSIDAAEITIESSNTDLATVSEGVVSLVADATGTTTITATFAGNDDFKPATVSYKITVNPAHSIYVSPSLNVNFGNVDKDAEVADKTITVTLTGVDAATLTLAGDGASAFTISPAAALTASGDITISASSANLGTFAATLTISDDASQAESKVVHLSLTVTDEEPSDEETPVSTTSKWVAATEIADGMQVLIVGERNEKIYAVGAQTSNNRTAVEGSLSEGVFSPGENTMAFTVVAQEGGTYALQASNGKYLYAAGSGSGKNYLRSQDEVDDNAKWTLSVSSATANGTSTNNKLQLNNSSDIFSCYSSTQKAIQFYVPYVAPTYVAQIGDNKYESLPAAVAAAQDGQTVELLMDVAAGPGVMITTAEHKQIIIDFGNHTYCATSPVGSAGTENQAFHFEKGCNITLQNGTITSSGDEIIMLIQNYGDLTLLNITLIGNNLPGTHRYVLSNNCGNVVIGAGTTITAKEGDVAFNVCVTNDYQEGTNVTVKPGATITGIVEYHVLGSRPAENNATLTIEGGLLNVTWNVDPALAEDAKDNIKVSGGTFNAEVPADYCAPGYIPQDNGSGQYGVHYVGYYERGSLTPGNYATICLPNGGTISGAKLFDLEYYDGTMLYLLEVEGNTMVAGRPYIFLPSVEKIKVIYTDAENATAGTYNGLVGSLSLDAEVITPDAGNYILYNNQYWYVNSLAYVGANRAYIHMDGVPTEPSTPQVGQAPRRRVAMAVNGKQTTTGIDALNATEAPVKMIIDGQLYILRGEKMYNANGQIVK